MCESRGRGIPTRGEVKHVKFKDVAARPPQSRRLQPLPIYVMSPDFERCNFLPQEKKQNTRILFNYYRVDRLASSCRKNPDLMGAQGGLEWVELKLFPRLANGILLRRTEGVKLFPEQISGKKDPLQVGGVFCRASSIRSVRPSRASCRPKKKSFGI